MFPRAGLIFPIFNTPGRQKIGNWNLDRHKFRKTHGKIDAGHQKPRKALGKWNLERQKLPKRRGEWSLER